MDELRKAITDRLNHMGILSTDLFVESVAKRVEQDADTLWNEWDIVIGIKNEINEMIETRDY